MMVAWMILWLATGTPGQVAQKAEPGRKAVKWDRRSGCVSRHATTSSSPR